MTPEECDRFYEAALTAGAILSGFIGTFVNFRIQRESNYYRQPVTKFDEGATHGRGQDAWIGLSRFNSSFLLIILAAFCSTAYGVFLPLSALAHWPRFTVSAPTILAGIVASLILVAAYFLDELIHYEVLKPSRLVSDLKSWACHDWILVLSGVLLALLFAYLVYFSARY